MIQFFHFLSCKVFFSFFFFKSYLCIEIMDTKQYENNFPNLKNTERYLDSWKTLLLFFDCETICSSIAFTFAILCLSKPSWKQYKYLYSLKMSAS